MQIEPRSHGLWDMTAAAGPLTGPLDRDLAADVLVVGAGFTGLSAALHLAEGGARVVVLEAAEPGFGGSGRNVGLVNAGLWVMPDDVIETLGEVYGERLLALLGGAPQLVFDLIARHGIDCEAVRAGTLHCAVGNPGLAEIEARAAQWRARGAPVRLLDAATAAQAIGSAAYRGALQDDRAGTVQPLSYVRGLARAALEAGARICSASPVTGATRANDRWLVRSGAGSVVARWILVCTNAYTGTAPGATPWSEIREELVALPYFQCATTPLGHNLRGSILPGRQGAWDTRTILTSFRLDQAGRLIMGSVGALRGTGTPIHVAWARRTMRRLFPQAEGLDFETIWHGRIGMTADSMPRFHAFGDQVVGFSGYNGRGIAPGTVFGRSLAQLVLGEIGVEDLPLPVTRPAPDRFRRLKEGYYEAGAQVAHLAEGRGQGHP